MAEEKKEEGKETVKKIRSMFDAVYDSSEYTDRRRKWKRWLKEYEGVWWADQESNPVSSKVSYNILFATVETNASLLTDSKPIWTVLSRWPEHQPIADNMTAASQALWDAVEMDMKLLLAGKDSQIFGTGLFKVYFSPEEDEIEVEIVEPSTFAMAPGYDDVWKAAWCGQKRPQPLDWVKRAYPEASQDIESDELENKDELLRERTDAEDDTEMVTVYEIWMRDDAVAEEKDEETGETRKEPRYPYGRIITFTAGDVLLDDRPSPFRHGKPPYVALHDYVNPHQFWGIGEAQQTENLIREVNARLQDAVDHARRYGKTNYIVSAELGISDEKLKMALEQGNQFLRAKGEVHRDMVIELQGPQINRSTLDIINMLPPMIEEITGVTDVTKGQIGKKERQSASEVSILIESSYTRTRQRVRNMEFSIKRLLRLILDLMQQYYDSPRPYQFREDNQVAYGYMSNDPQFVMEQMKPNVPDMPEEQMHPAHQKMMQDYRKLMEDFLGKEEVFIEYEIQIDTNSTLPLDKQSLANLAMRLAEKQILPKEGLLEILRFPNRERYAKMLKDERKEELQMKIEAKQQLQGGGQQPQQGQPAPPQQAAQMQRGG